MFDLNLTIGRGGEGEIGTGACESRASPSRGAELVTRELFPVSRVDEPGGPVQARKNRRGPRSRSSQYRGVTFYRRTGRWESHIWDCGKQLYLGGFDTALAAARAYDRAAIKFRGVKADINFNLSDYDDMKQMTNLSKEEFVQLLRRQSNGFGRGGCKYRGLLANKGYNKAANFESGAYNGHDLDLSLGTPEVKGNLGNMKRLISHRPLEGLPVALLEHCNNCWTALIPNYNEENGYSSSPLPLVYSAHHPNTSANDASKYFSWLTPPS